MQTCGRKLGHSSRLRSNENKVVILSRYARGSTVVGPGTPSFRKVGLRVCTVDQWYRRVWLVMIEAGRRELAKTVLASRPFPCVFFR